MLDSVYICVCVFIIHLRYTITYSTTNEVTASLFLSTLLCNTPNKPRRPDEIYHRALSHTICSNIFTDIYRHTNSIKHPPNDNGDTNTTHVCMISREIESPIAASTTTSVWFDMRGCKWSTRLCIWVLRLLPGDPSKRGVFVRALWMLWHICVTPQLLIECASTACWKFCVAAASPLSI